MPEPTSPDAPGLRLLLPPNLGAAAARDAIPVKIAGPVESLPELLRSACRGRGPWLLQLRRAELRALVALLAGRPAFAWIHRPADPIAWQGVSLPGVTEILAGAPDAAPAPPPAPTQAVSRKHLQPGPAPAGPVVDGSEHFLAVTPPAREHPGCAPLTEALKAAGFLLEPASRRWWLRDRHRTLAFLAAHGDRLAGEWGAQFTANFRERTAHLRRASVSAVARDAGDALEVDLSLDAAGAPPEAVQTQLAQGRNYVEHAGTIHLFSPATLEALRETQRRLAGDPNAPLLHRSRHRIPRVRAAEALEAVEAASPGFQPPEAWRARAAALHDLARLAPVPGGAADQLRPYQRLGAAWLHHLAANGLGGILADEMGLGKTAQALALLEARRAAGHADGSPRRTALVVCPASLVENWRREAARFAPRLGVFIHHGASRLGDPAAFARHDLVITSYGMLVRDEALFAGVDLDCLVADEAQHAKNRRTQAASALRSLRAAARFCLTGTPVENSLEDLRSLFEILLPGAFAPVPSDARGGERAWHEARLLRQTAPYLLRRTKAQVAADLPAKIEQTLWCEPTAGQREFYEEVRAATEREIDALAGAGRPEGQVRLAVLTQLLRLRQVCCDPRLVDPALSPAEGGAGRFTPSDSAKLAAFRELLDEALDGGHRVLVFSQFTRLLDLLGAELAAAGIPCCRLDGSMTARARQAEVDRFQGDATVPVFLISLKAGGTGLNLTGADTVVHFDPWWNPAAEAQATDRAHRIGQTRVVTSYKLVVSGTVEEKVLQLQESKRRLLAGVFEASDALTASLELADLRELVR